MASSPPSKRMRTTHCLDFDVAANYASPASSSQLPKLPPVVVFAHGAGAPSSSDWIVRWKDRLREAVHAVEVVTFDYPYIYSRRKAPPKAEKLVPFHSDIVKRTMAKYPNHPLILAGKSMGSRLLYNVPFNLFVIGTPRISCMVAGEEDIHASAIICLGYPLKGLKGAIRDETLLQVTVPIIFVQGSKDSLCPLNMLEAVRKKMTTVSGLHVIEGGDHSFQIGKKHLQITGSSKDEAEDAAAEAIAAFVSKSLELT